MPIQPAPVSDTQLATIASEEFAKNIVAIIGVFRLAVAVIVIGVPMVP